MTPTTEIKHTTQQGYRWLLNGLLPLAACLAIVTAAPAAHAQLTNQSVACGAAQKTEGEGGSAGLAAMQQKTEGEGGSAALSAMRQKTEGEGGSPSTFAQQKTAAIPCKG